MPPATVRIVRGPAVESEHRVHVLVADAQGRLVAHAGNPRRVAFLRSTLKPQQAVPLVESGAADAFGLKADALAVVAGSHNGEPRHVALVQGILERAGLDDTALQCGVHAPMGEAAARAVGGDYTALHHNCSGKHAGFLATCVHQGWDVAGYLDPEHPLQRWVRDIVAREAGLAPDRLQSATDGCSAPTFAVPLAAAARIYAGLTAADTSLGQARALARIRDAMMAHPDLVAGEGRTDTRFMRAVPGRLWVKAGAEACYAAGWTPRGLGIVLKVEDGSSRAVAPVLLRTLQWLGAVDSAAAAELERVVFAPVRNWRGLDVGHVDVDLDLVRGSLS